MNKADATAAAKSLQSCPTLRPHRWQPTKLPHPWDSPGKNTGVGCHFLLQCMKVKSESEVAQSCPTPSNPIDCSPPGSFVHGIFQTRVLEWGNHYQRENQMHGRTCGLCGFPAVGARTFHGSPGVTTLVHSHLKSQSC